MKKNIAIFGIAAFSVLGLCLSVSTASALTAEEREQKKVEREEKREERKAQIEEKREEHKERVEERKEKREEMKEKRCENATKRIQTRVQRYENKQAQHRNVFGKLVTRVETVRDRLKEKGLDTSELTSSIATLKGKVQELEAEHKSFIEGLEATEEYECGSSDGKFREKLGEARKMSVEVRAKLVDVRNYYQTVVRPEIIELREQLEDEDDTETSEASEATK